MKPRIYKSLVYTGWALALRTDCIIYYPTWKLAIYAFNCMLKTGLLRREINY